MIVYGLDFTSSPSDSKPITKAVCSFEDSVLAVESLGVCTNWQAFAIFLSGEGEWIAGIDFPFGQPVRLIEDLGWPGDWGQYVAKVAELSKRKYAELIDAYRARQPKGQKEHFREIDRRAGSLSPMKMYGIPVGKMFHQGAPFLLTSPCKVVPFRTDTHSPATLIEAYPGLVARKFIQRRSYKNDDPTKQTDEQRVARKDICTAIRACDGAMKKSYGFRVAVTDDLIAQCVEDPTGDRLDAILCAVQAAWAGDHRTDNFGVPANLAEHRICIEGWIPDPETT